jgi:hypothetical protein
VKECCRAQHCCTMLSIAAQWRVEYCCTLLNIVLHCWTLLNIVEHCCTLLYIVAHCCIMLNIAAQRWTLLRNEQLNIVVHCCTMLYTFFLQEFFRLEVAERLIGLTIILTSEAYFLVSPPKV